MSATNASPTNVSSGTRSIVAPPSTKWIGGSTWVPVWVLMEMTDRFETSPLLHVRCAFDRDDGIAGIGQHPGTDGQA